MRRLAVVEILIGMACFAVGLVSGGRIHMALLSLGALYLFPDGVALAYVSGFKPLGFGNLLLAAHGIPAVLAPFVSVYRIGLGVFLAALSAIAMIILVFQVYSRLQGGSRFELGLTLLPYIYVVLVLPVSLYKGSGFFETYSLVIYSYTIPLIYAVSINAVPRTYGFRASRLSSALLMVLVGAGSFLYAYGFKEGLLMVGFSLILYVFTIGLYRAPGLLAEIWGKEGVAARAHKYLLEGYLLAALVSLTAGVLMALHVSSGWPRPGYLVHLLSMGVVGIHIYIHAPLMLPVILSTPTARRYNESAYVLLLASVLARYWYPGLSLILLAASLVALVLMIKPVHLGKTG